MRAVRTRGRMSSRFAGRPISMRLRQRLPRGVDVAADHGDAGTELDDPPGGLQRPHGVGEVALQGVEDRQPAGAGKIDVGRQPLHVGRGHGLAKLRHRALRVDVARWRIPAAFPCPARRRAGRSGCRRTSRRRRSRRAGSGFPAARRSGRGAGPPQHPGRSAGIARRRGPAGGRSPSAAAASG